LAHRTSNAAPTAADARAEPAEALDALRTLSSERSTLADQIDQLRRTLGDDTVAGAQWERTSTILDRFGRFAADGCGLGDLGEVTSGIARSFVTAPTGTGQVPSISTMHWRRTALRLLFKAARSQALIDGDPTLDLRLPPRSSLGTRPLTDDEVTLCRSVAQWSLAGSRRAAVWALAEATCRSSELPNMSGDDVDLDSGRVWIAGGKTTAAREGQLTDWGLVQVRARIDELEASSLPLVYSGRSPAGAGQVSGASALVDVLTRAGLHQEPDVRPGSVAGWAGRRVLEETGRIDCAARALGVRSLDRAASIVAWDWQADPEPTDR
jgi:integrase/recombinase XerC